MALTMGFAALVTLLGVKGVGVLLVAGVIFVILYSKVKVSWKTRGCQ